MTQNLIDLKRDRAAIENVLRQNGVENPAARSFRCPLPKHDDEHPSAGLYQTSAGEWRLKCQGCGENLDIFGLYMRLHGVDFRVAATVLGATFSNGNGKPRTASTLKSAQPAIDWAKRSREYEAHVTSEQLDALADALGVSVHSLRALHVGHDSAMFTIPERDGAGSIIGIARRDIHGRKDFHEGGNRGLIIPDGVSDSGVLHVAEGASDAAAFLELGLPAIGRANNASGGHHLAAYWRAHPDVELLIVGDADDPGRMGSPKVARETATKLGRAVRWSIIADASDVRDYWLANRGLGDALAQQLDGDATIEHAAPEHVTPNAGTATETVESTEPKLRASSAASIQPRRVAWLWPGRIPLGMMCQLQGDPKGGKSLLTVDLAARISSGTPWPDAPDVPNAAGDVLLFSAEDPANCVIVPRLIAAAADLARVHIVEGVEQPQSGDVAHFNLAADVRRLEDYITSMSTPPKLVCLDPLSAYMGGTETHRDASVRSVLAPLTALAGRIGFALVTVTHMSKNGGTKSAYRGQGSIAFMASARMTWQVSTDTNDKTRRLLLHVGGNLGPDPGGLAFSIREESLAAVPAPHIAWETGRVDMDADDALAEEERRGRPPTLLEEASAWLRDKLARGPMKAADIIEAAAEEDITESTLRRAKKQAGVTSTPEHDGAHLSGHVWKLPETDHEHREYAE